MTVDWSTLTHAYGTAEDVPDLLAALGGDDPDAAEEALSELFGNVFHQGTVYEATVPFVDELVGLLAIARYQRGDLYAMLGMLADPAHAYGEWADAVRERVRRHADRFVDGLGDADPEVRALAAYAAGQCGDAFELDVLRDRWDVEVEPRVRGSLAFALGRRDPDVATRLRPAVGDPDGEVAVCAALALRRAGDPWPPGATDAVVRAFAARPDLRPDHPWINSGALNELVALMLPTEATEVLRRLLASPAAVSLALSAIVVECHRRRSAPAALLPLLEPLLDGEDPAPAIEVLRHGGRAAGRYGDVLARVAAGYPDAVAASAVATLRHLDDPRWLEPLVAALRAGHQPERWFGHIFYSEREIDILRTGLGRAVADADRPVAAWIAGELRLARRQAAPAAAELRAALDLVPEPAAWALAAAGATDERVRSILRTDPSLAAAAAVWSIDGDATPVLAAVDALPGPKLGANALSTLLPAATALGPVLDRITPWLDGPHATSVPLGRSQITAATLVWRATADASLVRPTLVAALTVEDPHVRDRVAGEAAKLAAEIGDTALVPLLRPHLSGMWSRVDACDALYRLGADPDDLVPVLLTALDAPYGHGGAVELLRTIGGPTVLAGLRTRAAADTRTRTAGVWTELVWSDERHVDALRDAIAALSTP